MVFWGQALLLIAMSGRNTAKKEPSLALFTDQYELTMAQAYWQSGMDGLATFSLTFRGYPPHRAYYALAGVDEVLDHMEGFRFTPDDIAYLESTGKFDPGFLEFLAEVRFTGSVRAMAEGTVFFANEPVIEVTAPILEAQVLETFLLNRINLGSLLATKASRVVYAARGRSVVDFGARRTQGVDAANALARVSFIAGFNGTSNMMAGRLHGIPTFGTMAHSFVEAFGSEEESFRAYRASFSDSSTFLVDTYDTIDGVKTAIEVAREMERQGQSLRAVRLDSGDLLELSKRARSLLDRAGLAGVEVFASGGLDEFAVEALVEAGAPIDGFGVGTRVGVSADAPWTDCVYKLVEYEGRPTLKLSTGKQTSPGAKQVFRSRDAQARFAGDVIGLAGQSPPDDAAELLLTQVMSNGRRHEKPLSATDQRKRFKKEFALVPERHKDLRSPGGYPVNLTPELEGLQRETVDKVKLGHGQV